MKALFFIPKLNIQVFEKCVVCYRKYLTSEILVNMSVERGSSLTESQSAIRDVSLEYLRLVVFEKLHCINFSDPQVFTTNTAAPEQRRFALLFPIRSDFQYQQHHFLKNEATIFCIKLYNFPFRDNEESEGSHAPVHCYCSYNRSTSERRCFILSI